MFIRKTSSSVHARITRRKKFAALLCNSGAIENILRKFYIQEVKPVKIAEPDMTTTQGTGALENLHLAPLRSLSDFLMESARFQLPNFQDFEKWGNRVVNNLLYYQTNYFLMSAAVFLLVGLLHPMKVLLGLAIIGALVYVFVKFFAQDARRSVGADPNQQPNKWAVLAGTLGGSYLVLYLFASVLIVALAVLLPFSLTFVHASLRLRNIKNKITNAVEIVGVKQSPMGQFLEAMGLMPTAF